MQQQENQNIEYKEIWRDECLKWICGFANAHGGTIYVGVNDSGKVIGMRNVRKLMEDIPNKIQSSLGIIAHDPSILQNGTHVQVGKFANRVDILYHDMLEGSLITTADKIVDLIFLNYIL